MVTDPLASRDIHEVLAQREKGSHPNLAPPVMLDIANDAHWAAVHQGQGQGGYDGIIMRKSSSSTPCRKPPSSLADGFMIVNVIHCCPDGLPERVFQHLASAPCPEVAHTQVQLGGGLLKPGGWIGVYGPFLADDGSYRSPADEEVSPIPFLSNPIATAFQRSSQTDLDVGTSLTRRISAHTTPA